MKHSLAITLAMTVFSTVALAAELVVTEANAPTFYRDFDRLTRQPRFVSAFMAMRCTTATPSAQEIERERQTTGPHYRARVHLYANPIAVPTFETPGESFGVGSVIVKEKLGAKNEVTAVGGMIKRAPGYDADNGDWEYFYYGKPGEFDAGRIENCVACHAAARKTDHVYSFSFIKR